MYNFVKKYDEDNELFSQNIHSCKYYEMDELKKVFLNNSANFSTFSHNIRSINGHWDDILDIIDSATPVKFSVVALQEIWNVPKILTIPGYCKSEFLTCDQMVP